LGTVSDAAAKHNLDFDDAYQYATAELSSLSRWSWLDVKPVLT